MDKLKNQIKGILPCILYSILGGCITGVAIFLFKLAANHIEKISRTLFSAAKSSPVYIIAAFAILIAAAYLLVLMQKHIPEAKGGGIPRSEGVLRGVLSFRWLATLMGTVSGSLLSFFCGVPVGSEGPAVLIGTSLGRMCLGKSKHKSAWSRYVMTGGAGAGFAVATGSPLSGILFALEEIHKRFTPMLVMAVSLSVVSATYINQILCGLFNLNPSLFVIGELKSFSLDHILYLLLFAVIIALLVGAYDISIIYVSKFTARFKKHLTPFVKTAIVFMLTGIFAFFYSDGVYNGHHLIVHILEHNPGVWVLLACLVVRFVMMILVSDGGVTGGSFIPTLAIGTVISALVSKLLIFMGLPEELMLTVILLGTCAFIGGTLRAPLTATVLFMELSGQFVNILFVAVVIFTVNAITEFFNIEPFYERSIERMVEDMHGNKKAKIANFSTTIGENAFVNGKTVRDVMWPSSTVVTSIKRAADRENDMCNDGEKTLYAGDTIVLRVKYYDEDELFELIRGLVGENAEIHKIEM